jgi:hypothetical protein
MDLILLILAVSKKQLLASEVATLTARDVNAVRHSLAFLAREGLAQRTRINTRGPLGTFTWGPTPTGRAAAAELAAWFRSQLQ